MTEESIELLPLWRQCELRWADWLVDQGYDVALLADATGNVAYTKAPMLRSLAGDRRAPDLASLDAEGLTEFWEIKYRSRPDIDEATGEPGYWVSDAALADYLKTADRAPFWIVLYEPPNAHHGGRWLRASAREIKDGGRREVRYGRGGQPIDAWVWPATVMSIVAGPEVTAPTSDEPMVVDEGSGDWVTNSDIFVAGVRQWLVEQSDGPADRLIGADPRLSLEATARQLGLPSTPQYSVTRIGSMNEREAALLPALLEHGIRVYVVSNHDPTLPITSPRLHSWRATRLLEVALVPDPPVVQAWVIDGQTDKCEKQVVEALKTADRTSRFNLGQYEVVHSDPDTNVVVTAGAGTGKTETMTERMIYLLSTSASRGAIGEGPPQVLRANELVFVTFTQEAAAQMRSRLNLALLLRQRLCARPAQPYRQWANEMTSTRVSTLHSFAQDLIARLGAEAGYASVVPTGSLVMPFRAIVQNCLSPHLASIYTEWRLAPPEFEWQKHIETVWSAIENRAPMMSLHGATSQDVDLGTSAGDKINARVVDITNDVLEGVADAFATFCRDQGTVPLSHFIPLALAVLQEAPTNSVDSLRYIFVDEFQDTDAQQINLLVELMRVTNCRAFLVGDVKQGIYRFRGAAGDAFKQVTKDFEGANQRHHEYALSKNFRSTPTLLDDMDQLFRAWRQKDLLDYKLTLTAMKPTTAGQPGVRAVMAPWDEQGAADVAADEIAAWKADDEHAGIGILCRTNRQAALMKDVLDRRGIDCVTYTGGDFYRTPAVRDFRAILEAIADPNNKAALIEVMQTRWGGGLATLEPPAALRLAESEAAEWRSSAITLSSWTTRVGEFANGSFDNSDLLPLRQRLRILSSLARRTSALNLLTTLVAAFQPAAADEDAIPSHDHARYARCLTHLLTILVEFFEGGSATLPSMLEWLRLKIATDDSESEPVDPDLVQGDRVCVALTVHKAKGLEYSRVIIPFTRSKFLKRPAQGRTSASVVDHDGKPRLLWEWNARTPSLTNANSASRAAAADRHESRKEEARLLYVAMTRAEDELVVLTGAAPTNDKIETWDHLIHLGDFS